MEGTLQQAGVDQTLPGRGDCALGRAGIPARYRPGHSTADIADHFQIAARLLVCCDAGGSKAGRTGPGRPGSPRSLWAGDLIINTISAVTTRTGLTVTAVLDHSPCPTGTRVSNEQMTDLKPGCGGVGFLGGADVGVGRLQGLGPGLGFGGSGLGGDGSGFGAAAGGLSLGDLMV